MVGNGPAFSFVEQNGDAGDFFFLQMLQLNVKSKKQIQSPDSYSGKESSLTATCWAVPCCRAMNNGPKQNPFCLLGDQSWGQVHIPETLTQTVFPRAFKRPWPGAEEGGFGGFRTDLVFSLFRNSQ